VHDEPADRLGELSADRAPAPVCRYTIELGKFHRSIVDVEAACAFPEGLDRRVDAGVCAGTSDWPGESRMDGALARRPFNRDLANVAVLRRGDQGIDRSIVLSGPLMRRSFGGAIPDPSMPDILKEVNIRTTTFR